MYYAGISECDVLNGEGFRVVLFVSGCNHYCPFCQNEKTWNPYFGHKFTFETEKYILHCLKKDYIDGITITGGDPLYYDNRGRVMMLIQSIKNICPDKDIWLYTGYKWEEILSMRKESSLIDRIVSLIDVLVDGEYDQGLRDLTYPWAGSTNQRVIDVQKSLEKNQVVLWKDTQKDLSVSQRHNKTE